MPLAHPIEDYASVRNWQKRLHEQWGGDPLGEDPGKLAALSGFCDFLGKDPDQLLAYCFLRKKASGAKFGSTMRREEVAKWLRDWRAECAEAGKAGVDARKATSDVLSFLIHGGVLIHPGMV